MMTRVHLDRIASSTQNAHLDREVLLGREIICAHGYILAVRLLTDKSVYNQLEDVYGRLIPLRLGDIIAGTLGSRRALKGYAGSVPKNLQPGDEVQVLNLGGVLGQCEAIHPDLGPPFNAEVLGAILTFPPAGDRVGTPATISRNAIPQADTLESAVPIVFVAGSSMNSGKTVAATEIVRGLGRAGMRVGAVKLTGVSLRRDALSMLDAGATIGLTFNDAGVVSTNAEDALPTAYGLLNHIAKTARPDVIVAELGDGILGEYGVATLLEDQTLMAHNAALVVCTTDQVGAWGAVTLLESRFGLRPTLLSGPVTDNAVGCSYIVNNLGIPAHNARREHEQLIATIRGALDARR
ncbi:MAG: hypothetical protein A2289_17480 [Deltaproteobacteria bacterium RIFOXYA12_FULL_58_15]|nr:MAG: hypothetical protein A2289_17480 [Deltaproteobacteria bacterium RIFOXYA12_FULL_58_15]OGR15234.1 MAG: hypothetical protein A2341_09070 [Deltaproteobacteria bacterium RIFOXYB12_FULL_58_9]